MRRREMIFPSFVHAPLVTFAIDRKVTRAKFLAKNEFICAILTRKCANRRGNVTGGAPFRDFFLVKAEALLLTFSLSPFAL